ncbi:hypothetical protein HKX48_007323, partial [Thoreauomyces humboldtii]
MEDEITPRTSPHKHDPLRRTPAPYSFVAGKATDSRQAEQGTFLHACVRRTLRLVGTGLIIIVTCNYAIGTATIFLTSLAVHLAVRAVKSSPMVVKAGLDAAVDAGSVVLRASRLAIDAASTALDSARTMLSDFSNYAYERKNAASAATRSDLHAVADCNDESDSEEDTVVQNTPRRIARLERLAAEARALMHQANRAPITTTTITTTPSAGSAPAAEEPSHATQAPGAAEGPTTAPAPEKGPAQPAKKWWENLDWASDGTVEGEDDDEWLQHPDEAFYPTPSSSPTHAAAVPSPLPSPAPGAPPRPPPAGAARG